MLDLNITILFQLVNFLITVYVLNILIIRPIRNILAERREKIENIQSKIESFNSEAEGRLINYQASLQNARQEATQIREDARTSGITKQQEIVQEAARKGQKILIETQEAIKAEAKIAIAELRKQVKAFGNKVVATVLK